MSVEFKYDVAFSFLGSDEPVARKLNDLLAGRVTTFIYSDADRQVTLGGTDGGVQFARVFGLEARTVVVLTVTGGARTDSPLSRATLSAIARTSLDTTS